MYELEEIVKENEDIGIMCITEHWKSEDQLLNYALPNFKLMAKFCRNEGEHGGVAMYVRNDIQAKERKEICKISKKGKFECAGVEYNLKEATFVCITIYSNGDTELLKEKLSPIMDGLTRDHIDIIVTGDFNVNMMGNNSRKSELLNFFSTYNIKQTIFEPTRTTETSSTCIDGIYTSIEVPYYTQVMKTHISDHTAQKISFRYDTSCEFILRRIFSKENIQKLKEYLINQDWSQIYNTDGSDVNLQFEKFHRLYTDHLNKACPLTKLRNRKINRLDRSNPKIREIKNRLDILLVLKEGNSELKEEYKQVKKEYDSALIQQKQKALEEKINNADNKNKATWSIINSLKNKNKSRELPLKGNPKKIANDMNNFFVNNASQLTKSIIKNKFNKNEENKEPERKFQLNALSSEELKSIIKKMKNKHSSGIDGISNSLIRQTCDEIIEPLKFIINNSIKTGVFPDSLKTAVIVPIYKGGDEACYGNYRPISVITSFSKIFEMAFCSQLMEFLLESAFFKKSQHGYLRGRSIQTAMYQFVKKVTDAFEDGDLAFGLFLDLSKAYDCLDSKVLLRKLQCCGVEGTALQWITSYLQGRTQLVRICMNGMEVTSDLRDIILGIAQGGIAGPLLFLVYLNDYGIEVDWFDGKIMSVHYADDTNLLAVETLWPDLKLLASQVMEYTEKWFGENNLILNNAKTNSILFHPTIGSPRDITLNGCKVAVSEHAKFLGIVIDHRLNWSAHIDSLCEGLGSSIYALLTLSKHLNARVMKTIYHATIESKIRFGIIFYGSGNMSSLFILQKKAIRILNKMEYRQSCRGFFKGNGILTVYAIYAQECLLFLQKNKCMFEHFKSDHTHMTRNNNYNYPLCNLTTTQKQLEFRCLKLYNSLPDNIKRIEDTKCFKKKLFVYLLNLEPYSISDYIK